LLIVALMKLVEYYFQIPGLQGDVEDLGMVTLTAAFVCGVAWIVPDFLFRKRIPQQQRPPSAISNRRTKSN